MPGRIAVAGGSYGCAHGEVLPENIFLTDGRFQ